MVKKIIAALFSVALVFLAYVYFSPASYTISRELLIHAPAEKIFPLINNSKESQRWMPWTKTDPKVQMTYVGPDRGVGSEAKWQSEGQMGHGSALVVESIPGKLVRTKLTYTRPFAMEQMSEISLEPKGADSLVKWSVTGENNFVGRLFCLVMNMDKIVGAEFEKGLLSLQQLVEAKGD